MNIEAERIQEFLSRRSRLELHQPGLNKAGVLLLLFRKDGELRVLLTKRSAEVEHHKGQVSFPGGSVDAGDADIIATAVRETEEEIGIPAQRIRILGLFDDVWTPSGFSITPVVGYTDAPPEARLSPEVEEVLEVPVAFFLDPRNERVKQLTREGKLLDVYFYTWGKTEIWGATAWMMRSFLHALREAL